MIAFHGKPEIKSKYLRRVRAHKKADQIIKGTYWENGKGCAVGCTLHSANHMAYESELGIPVQLAYLEDTIFENLPNGKAKDFPERFLMAAKPGADLSHVVNHFLIWLLVDGVSGVISFAQTEADKTAIKNVAELHKQVISGNPLSAEEWAEEWAAWAAAEWAAWAAEEWAAWARDSAYISFADKLIELMEAA